MDLLFNLIGKDVSASSSIKGVGKAAQSTHTDIEKTHRGIGKLGGGLGLMGKAAIGSGVALAGIAFGKVASEGLSMAATLEQSAAGFTTMLGSAEKSQKFVKEMSDFAAKTPFEFPELADSAQTMMAFGFNAKDVIPTMTKVGDAVGALGGTSETVDRVVMALGQMKAKGKVSGEEMLQLTEAGIPAWQLLADKIGKTVPEAQEAARKGQIDLDTAMTGIIDGMGKKYAGGMEAQAKTITGMMSTLKDNVGLALANIVTPLLPFIKDAIGAASDFAGKVGPQIGKSMERLGPVLKTVFDYIKDAAAKIIPKLVEYWGKLREGFEEARPGLEKIAKVLGVFAKMIFEKVVPALLDVAGKVVPLLLKALGKFGEFLPTIGGAMLGFGKLAITIFSRVFDTILAGVEWIIKAASKIPGPWQDEMKAAAAAVEGFRDDSKVALDGAVDAIEGAEDSLKSMREEAKRDKTAKLKVEKTQAERDLAAVKRQLKDPELTKERKAQLKAEKKQLEQTIRDAKTELASIKDEEVKLKVKVTVTSDGRVVKVGVPGKPAYAGGMNSGVPGGLMAATMGRGSPGAVFGQWGPRWSWNRRNGRGQHDGADISAGFGTPVYATRSGRVIAARWMGNSHWAGNHVIWQSGNTRFIYAHLSSIGKSSGAVGPGSYLGRVGRSGNASGPHLHIQASRGGRYVNPVYALASGGIVRRRPGGTLAVIGEGRYDEAVVPLPRGRASVGGGDVHIHIHGGLDSADTIARRVQTALLDLKRRQGVALGLA
jgi:tape measure domain-containing protein